MTAYTIYNIYKRNEETYNIEVENMEEVHDWIKNNLKLSYSWVIQDGEKKTDFKITTYRVSDCPSRSETIHINKNSVSTLRSNAFVTKEEAMYDYVQHLDKAKEKLDSVYKELKRLQYNLGFSLDYFIDGDTHGIHEEFQYITVEEGGYSFHLIIED